MRFVLNIGKLFELRIDPIELRYPDKSGYLGSSFISFIFSANTILIGPSESVWVEFAVLVRRMYFFFHLFFLSKCQERL